MILCLHLPWLQVVQTSEQQFEVILRHRSELSQRSICHHRLVSLVAHGHGVGAHFTVNKSELVFIGLMFHLCADFVCDLVSDLAALIDSGDVVSKTKLERCEFTLVIFEPASGECWLAPLLLGGWFMR